MLEAMDAFADRVAAGELLADRLRGIARNDAVVLGLPRGGVVVAAQVASRLSAPLDVVVVRKLRTPGHAELAMGALAVFGTHTAVVRVEDVIDRARIDDSTFESAHRRELEVARQRSAEWSPNPPGVAGRTAVAVDDGLATGATMRAAIAVLREAGAARVVAAAPVGAAETVRGLDAEVVCLLTPPRFRAVGVHYRDFGEVSDDTVRELLQT